jgi:hypothetical protein
MGFEVIDAEQYASEERLRFCDLSTEESLRNNIGPLMVNLERRIRDASSIATVLRLRGDAQRAHAIAETGWIMITRNDAVANRSQGFLEVRKLIERDQVPPAITDRRLAGYLWFAVGGSIGALSRKKLVANCSYVMTPRTDVVSKARQYLCELDPTKADVVVALMRDQRAQRCLMRSTLGFPSAVRRDNAEQLLEEVRLSVASEVRAQAEVREAEIRARHETAIAALSSARQTDQLEGQSAILRLQEDLARERQEAAQRIGERDERAGTLSDRLNALELLVNSDVDGRVQRAVRRANVATMALKFLLAAVYLVLVGSAYWYLPGERVIYALLVTLVVALAAFWVVPQYVYDRLAEPLWMKCFQSRCEDLGVSEHAAKYMIKPLEGKAVRINLPQVSPEKATDV